MAVTKKTKYGQIDISSEAISKVIAEATLECYGVIGISNKSTNKENENTPLKEEEFYKGIKVSKEKNGYSIDIYVIIVKGVKITEILTEIQKKVSFVLDRTFKLKFRKVNVYAQTILDNE